MTDEDYLARAAALAAKTEALLERIDQTLAEPRSEGEWHGPADPPPPAMVRKVHTPRGPSSFSTALQSTLARVFAEERRRTDGDLDRLEARIAALEARLAALEGAEAPSLRLVEGGAS